MERKGSSVFTQQFKQNPQVTAAQSTKSPEQQQFCVRWNSHLGSLGVAIPQLLECQRFVDVTLACEGHQIHCHRLLLAACSKYFETILNENPCKHPVIILPLDIKLWEIQALIDFMYKGEVNVSQDGLIDLLKCADILQIRGLCGHGDKILNLRQGNVENLVNSDGNGNSKSRRNSVNSDISKSSSNGKITLNAMNFSNLINATNSGNSADSNIEISTNTKNNSTSLNFSNSENNLCSTHSVNSNASTNNSYDELNGLLTAAAAAYMQQQKHQDSLQFKENSLVVTSSSSGKMGNSKSQTHENCTVSSKEKNESSNANQISDKKHEILIGQTMVSFGSEIDLIDSKTAIKIHPKIEEIDKCGSSDEFDKKSIESAEYDYDRKIMDFEDIINSRKEINTDFPLSNVTCEYDSKININLDYSAGRRIRRSEEILKQAAECVSKGQTFQTVSDIFNIPISTIRFFMARKGILPRRKRGRTSGTSLCGAYSNPSENTSLKITRVQSGRNSSNEAETSIKTNSSNENENYSKTKTSSPQANSRSGSPFFFDNYNSPGKNLSYI